MKRKRTAQKGNCSRRQEDEMLADLNVSAEYQREVVASSSRLGFDCVAAAVRVTSGRLQEKDRCSIQPLDAPALSAKVPGLEQVLPVSGRFSWDNKSPPGLRQLTRITFVAKDHTQTQALTETPEITASYDLIAVQPMTERALKQACTALDIDIISIDLTQRLPFKLRPGMLKGALARGIVFEICYNAALRDGSTRLNFFNNAQALSRATNGKGIILSSGARAAFELRGPYDVINLGTLMGLTQEQAKAAVAVTPGEAIRHAENRKQPKGGIRIMAATELDADGLAEAEDDDAMEQD